MAAAYDYDPFPDEHLTSNYSLPQFDWASTGSEVVDVFKDRVKNRIVVITGPASGSIGGSTVFSLASAFPSIIVLVSRSLSVGPVIDAIRFRYGENAPIIHFVSCDLSSQPSVREAAANISRLVPRIDILINNAATPPGPYQESGEGIELQFATNHVGHFLLTNLLMPRILNGPRAVDSPKPRIVTVSSSAHNHCFHSPVENYNFSDGIINGALYDPRSAHIQSKAANVLFARGLARKLAHRDVLSFSVHPGSIETGFQDRIHAPITEQAEGARVTEARAMQRAKRKTVDQGCATILVASLDPRIEASTGGYLEDGKVVEDGLAGVMDRDEEAERLWQLSEILVGQSFDWS
ncbi:NAD(P)-binding protein [Viridothelium virens]|uniref:NAD(P)-binding protein n=1 Tax=Viridothelium virens TaxID=1048519 RepID=A0A6A6GYF3_VIRVR|nr:NAD(P)-binding protein [Viridothelium virens]